MDRRTSQTLVIVLVVAVLVFVWLVQTRNAGPPVAGPEAGGPADQSIHLALGNPSGAPTTRPIPTIS